MNIYLVDAGERFDYELLDGNAVARTSYHAIAWIAAETPGKARSIFCHETERNLEFTDIKHTRLIRKDVDLPMGEIGYYDLLRWVWSTLPCRRLGRDLLGQFAQEYWEA